MAATLKIYTSHPPLKFIVPAIISTLVGCITFSDPMPLEPRPFSSLYERYGGSSRVHEWATFLHGQIKAHQNHPNSEHLKFCLEMQLSSLLGGPIPYPGIVPGHPQCMDALTAHAHQAVTSQEFDSFTGQLVRVLQNSGVDGKELLEVVVPLLDLKAQIVNTPYE